MRDYKVEDMAHIGCTVPDLQTAVKFFKEVLNLENIRTQFIDYPYLSGVVGIKNCAIDIAFAKKDDADRVIELLDYKPPHKESYINDDTTIGSGRVCYTVANLDEVYTKCINKDTTAITVCDFGKYKGKRHFFTKQMQIPFEFIEGDVTMLVKVNYIVGDFNTALNYFDVLSFEKVYEEEGAVQLMCGKDSLIIELLSPQNVTLRKQDSMSSMVGNIHCCFLVANIEALHKELLNANALPQGKITHITHGLNSGASAVYLTGTDGIKTELFQGKKL